MSKSKSQIEIFLVLLLNVHFVKCQWQNVMLCTIRLMHIHRNRTIGGEIVFYPVLLRAIATIKNTCCRTFLPLHFWTSLRVCITAKCTTKHAIAHTHTHIQLCRPFAYRLAIYCTTHILRYIQHVHVHFIHISLIGGSGILQGTKLSNIPKLCEMDQFRYIEINVLDRQRQFDELEFN